MRERLRREARTVAALDHPNVVPLYEAGEEDGTVFIATRWVEGTELGDLIRRDRPMPAATLGAARRPDRVGARGGPRAGAVAPRHQAVERDRHARRTTSTSRTSGSPSVPESAVGLHRGPGRCSAPSTTWRPSRSRAASRTARRRLQPGLRALRDARRRAALRGARAAGWRKMWAHLNAPPPSIARAAARRARGARRGDPPRAWRSGRPTGPPLRRSAAAALRAAGETTRRLPAVERVGVEHDPPERDPRGAVVGRVAAVERRPRRPGASPGRPSGRRRRPPPAAATSATGCCVLARRLAGEVVARPGCRRAGWPSNAGQARAAIWRPSGDGSSA